MSRGLTARERLTLPLAFSAATLAVPVAAEMVEFDLSKAMAVERHFSAAPGDFVELCGKLLRNQIVAWRFEADGPLDFNIHYHEADQVTTPVKEDAVRSDRGRLPIAVEQDYCWMWTNRGTAPVNLHARLRDESKRTKP